MDGDETDEDCGGLRCKPCADGGYLPNGADAGVFSLDLTHAPSNWSNALGFRCVVPGR